MAEVEGTISGAGLGEDLSDARGHTLALISDLTDDQLMGPSLPIVNPLLWEIGHVAWFQEKWTLRHLYGEEPIRSDGDSLYDSAKVAHDSRWGLPLPDRQGTLEYMQEVLDRILDRLDHRAVSREVSYFHQLALFHEDMHTEAFTYARQTLGYPPPKFKQVSGVSSGEMNSSKPSSQDVEVPGGTFFLGASPASAFTFDNEKWLHPVDVKPFRISRTAVTNGEFQAFVEDGGYRQRRWWTKKGWEWRQLAGANHPVYWKKSRNRWFRRRFDELVELEPALPIIHVNWYEAEAFSRWAGRRLPSEVEWEMAASADPDQAGQAVFERKRIYPWGNELPSRRRANLDWQAMDCVPVEALPEGDSAFGCRQMVGNVWEWTASTFSPYPGFIQDPYKEYSEPWFATHKVLRGGCWATRSRLIRNTWRNFYTPDRRDVWAGFRTCASQP